jgi:DNA-binding FadR family transcriptional regulator
MNRAGVVVDIAQELGLRIVRGELAAGARLPSVRALAAEFQVNISTVQRVLVQLEERGLVVARPRSGVEVRDVETVGMSSIWPLVMLDASRQPDRALALLRDGLRCRRVLTVDLLPDLAQADVSGVAALVDQFEVVVVAEAPDLEVFDAENRLLVELLRSARRPAVLAVFNEVQRMIRSNELLLSVIFADRLGTLAIWRAMLDVVAAGGLDVALIGTVLTSFDERILMDFERRLRS